ncbi:MAG: OST-HTH/LOTUS domain-containing protein [Marinobacter sp.]|nr:OST-HTH/LOTUS domain-containing protein [Marinobacter sp.]
MGIGRRITPKAFVQSCEIFTYAEEFTPRDPKSQFLNLSLKKPVKNPIRKNVAQTEEPKKEIEVKESPDLDLSIIDKAFEISSNEDEEIHIAKIGASLRKIDPSFDPRSYGFRNLTELFRHLDKYVVVRNEVNGLNYPLVKLK